jgi:NAD(P)-dependent dehydrogenase (short-subunit alcohol dehydrogenase family)
MTEAVLDRRLLAEGGRVVNVSSGAASGWLSQQPKDIQALFTDGSRSWADLHAAVLEAAPSAPMGAYGLSKAALCAFTLQIAEMRPDLLVTSLSPGFIATKMTQGFGATLPPDAGTVSLMRCLFGDVKSGHYYGSDGLRSPLTVRRDPGAPEYDGEPDPDPATYKVTE